MQLLLNTSRTAHQWLNSASAAPLSVEVLIFDSLRSRCIGVILKRGAREGIRFSRKQPACLSLPGGFESAQGSDWQTLTDRLTFTQPFLPALPAILVLKILIFPPKPVHSQWLTPPPNHQPALLRSLYILIQPAWFSPLVSRFQSGALIRCIFSGMRMCRVARSQPGELWVEMGLHAKHKAPSLESRPLR